MGITNQMRYIVIIKLQGCPCNVCDEKYGKRNVKISLRWMFGFPLGLQIIQKQNYLQEPVKYLWKHVKQEGNNLTASNGFLMEKHLIGIKWP